MTFDASVIVFSIVPRRRACHCLLAYEDVATLLQRRRACANRVCMVLASHAGARRIPACTQRKEGNPMSGALDLFRLDGKVAVVTGGSKGIGMFYSQALAEAGASVVVADIYPVHVAQTSERLSKEHDGRILGADLDVT